MHHGQYFDAARTFLSNDGYKVISRALTRRLGHNVKSENIHEIRVCLVKHGEFYHPARIEALACNQKISFVLNVAVSDAGIRHIYEEYHCLKKLNRDLSLSFLPRVYGFGEVDSAGNRKVRMFLGEWFEGYNEFHISRDPSDDKLKILVWDDADNRFFLSPKQTADLYRQAARILTYYYNIESSEQIFSWHHAAGDFVVRIDDSGLDLKLITVRRYAPLFHNYIYPVESEKGVELILQALLIFFLNLSIRMRLDRLNGVGDIVWADRMAVQNTLEGFLEALALKPYVPWIPDSLDRCFSQYLSVCTKRDLDDLCKAVVNTLNPQAPDVPVIKWRLKEHVETLRLVIEDFFTKKF